MTDSGDSNRQHSPSSWEWEYQAAIRETNPLFLGEKIYAAETAIRKRQQEIENALESPEQKAIEKALGELQNLRIKIFGHSDWQT